MVGVDGNSGALRAAVHSSGVEGRRMRSVRQKVIAGLLLAAVFAFPASASTGANYVDSQQPFAQWFFNECTDELFYAAGTFNERVYFSVSDDGKLHFSAHINFQGVDGFTLSGVRYLVQRNDNSGFVADSDFAPFVSQVVFKEHYVRLQSGSALEKADDFFMSVRGHLTTNANGVTTLDRQPEIEVECN